MKTYNQEQDVRTVLDVLAKQLSELNGYMKSALTAERLPNQDPVHYLFDPVEKTDSIKYKKRVEMIMTINTVLNDCRFNVKSVGYSYIRDALCILYDYNCLDLCLNKEVYTVIAGKHNIGNTERIEHGIRNAIKAAYKSCAADENNASLMKQFDRRPSCKVFLMKAVQEVGARMAENKIAVLMK